MTKDEILQLVKEHFQEGGVRDDGSCSAYYGDTDAFVKFAQEIYAKGWDASRSAAKLAKTSDEQMGW